MVEKDELDLMYGTLLNQLEELENRVGSMSDEQVKMTQTKIDEIKAIFEKRSR